MIYTCSLPTPLGAMTASATNGALTGLWFVGQKYYPATTGWLPLPAYSVFTVLQAWLAGYFSRTSALPVIPIAPAGTPFQKAVWNILLAIPPGRVTTYGDIARQLAAQRGLASMSSQAVGGAVGHNPISVLIPCHRVVGSDKSLTGYAGGLDKKEALLRLEGAKMPWND